MSLLTEGMEVTCRCGATFNLAEAPWCNCDGVKTKLCPNGHCICHKLKDKELWRPATPAEQNYGFGSMLKEKHGGVKTPRGVKSDG